MDERGSPIQTMKIYIVGIGFAAAAAMLIRLFFVEAYRIPTDVMHPTLQPGDLIFVSKNAFGFRNPHNGEIVGKFEMPGYGDVVTYVTEDDPYRNYIKRVLALPGDKVGIKDGELVLNGKALELEAKTSEGSQKCGLEKHPAARYDVCIQEPFMEDFGPSEVPEGFVFVIGDLRTKDASLQPWRIVRVQEVKTKALWTWLSIVPADIAKDTPLFSRIRFDRMFETIR